MGKAKGNENAKQTKLQRSSDEVKRREHNAQQKM